MFEKFKQYAADDALYYTALLVLVGVIAFGLGRFSVPSVQEKPLQNVSTVQLATTDTATSTQENDEPRLVGSKNGSKYHLLWCPGASQIKETNKVFFESEAEAKAAGYSKAANCPGL